MSRASSRDSKYNVRLIGAAGTVAGTGSPRLIASIVE